MERRERIQVICSILMKCMVKTFDVIKMPVRFHYDLKSKTAPLKERRENTFVSSCMTSMRAKSVEKNVINSKDL